MALDKSKLKEGFLNLFGTGSSPAFPASADEAGQKWAEIISDYSSDGTASGIPVSVSPAAQSTLALALTAAFSTVPGTPSTVAQNMTTALTPFWATVTVSGAVPPTGLATGGPALLAGLTAIFSFVGGTADSKAEEISNALDTYTKLVQYSFAGPPPYVAFVV